MVLKLDNTKRGTISVPIIKQIRMLCILSLRKPKTKYVIVSFSITYELSKMDCLTFNYRIIAW